MEEKKKVQTCENCHEEHDGSYGSGRFCSVKCARGFATKANRKEISEKVSKTLTKHEKRYCGVCGVEVSKKNNSMLCKDHKVHYKKYDNEYYYVKDYRKKVKEKSVVYKGGKCIVCGYNTCNRSLHFHHRDPSEKDFDFSKIRSWEKTRKELDKCSLVCSNCHGEIHTGLHPDILKI